MTEFWRVVEDPTYGEDGVLEDWAADVEENSEEMEMEDA
jgi:hypothetical protein